MNKPIGYFLDNKKSDILKLNIYDDAFLDKELEKIFMKIEMTNEKKIPSKTTSYVTSNFGINKENLRYNRDTIANENFSLRDDYLMEKGDFFDDLDDKQKISRDHLIGTIRELDFQFGNTLENYRFRSDIAASSKNEDEVNNSDKLEMSDPGSDTGSQLERAHGLKGYNVSKFNREVYFPIFKKKYEMTTDSSHSFVEELRKVNDFGGSMINPPKTEIYLVDKSNLKGKFMISQPLYNEVSPYFDFGDEILSIFRGDRLASSVDYEFFGGYKLKTLFKKQGHLDNLEFCLQISGYIDEKEKLFNKQDKTETEIDDKLIDYLGLFYSSSRAETKRKDRPKIKPTLIPSVSKVRYYERPERHQIKRNFQVQVDIKAKYERTLTLNDFENKMKNLVNFKKKIFFNKADISKTEQDLYITEIEDTLDIILNLKPELLKSGIYQTFNQKVLLLLKNIKEFRSVYLGKLYCPEIIVFILKEYLQLQHGLHIKERENEKPMKMKVNQDGKKVNIKIFKRSQKKCEVL